MAVQYAFSQITTQGLKLAVDAADPLSYPGSGTVWTDVSGNGFTGTVSSSISFATTNRGALVSSNSSSAITFTGSAADFSTDSFTVEMAFTPQTINGQHFLFSKNSGSFPNFGAFLTGSGGSGRLVAFYNVSSTVSCSASTPTGSFVTGSNYIVDVTYVPSSLATFVYTNSNVAAQAGANGTGSLSTSASLFLLNNSTSSNAGSVANLYNFKVYNPNLGNPFIRRNYNAQAARFGLPLATYIPPAPLLLDTYSGAAAAYSLRKLRTSYSGAAIRVRRSSDNAEADIGFNVNDELDTATLLAFCGAGNGFVTTWYDQSGNGRNATQSAGANQPQIVSSGSVLTEGGKATIAHLSSRDLLLSPLNLGKTYSIYGVAKFTANDKELFGDANTGNSFSYGIYQTSTQLFHGAQSTFTGNIGAGYGLDFNILGIERLGTAAITIYKNANQFGTGNLSNNTGNFYLSDLSGERLTTFRFQGNLSEAIFYAIDQSSNRIGIQTNINSFYSIY